MIPKEIGCLTVDPTCLRFVASVIFEVGTGDCLLNFPVRKYPIKPSGSEAKSPNKMDFRLRRAGL